MPMTAGWHNVYEQNLQVERKVTGIACVIGLNQSHRTAPTAMEPATAQ